MPHCVARCRYCTCKLKSRWWPVVACGGRERRGIPFARVRRHTAATESHLTGTAPPRNSKAPFLTFSESQIEVRWVTGLGLRSRHTHLRSV